MARIAKNSSLYPEDIEIVTSYGKPLGLDFSSALRIVIREWAEMKQMGVVKVDELPRPDDAQPVPVIFVQKNGK